MTAGPAAGERLRLVAIVALCVSWASPSCAMAPSVQRLRVEVVEELPHDPASFTQGLLWHDGAFFESSGQYGQSRLRRIDSSGNLVREHELPDTLFAEGLARVGETLIQLTWKAGTAFVYDLASFDVIATHRYQGPGWGLCHDGQELVMSNGTSWLVRRDAATLSEVGRFQVTLEGRPLDQLNELECAEGWIYANLWQEDRIVRIAPDTGEVVAVIDASSLRRLIGPSIRPSDALNGIAFRPDTATFFITGKNWPKMFEVIFVE